VHTKPRQEKTLARQLSAIQIPHYVPQHEKKTISKSGRKRVAYVPLFPSYAFVFCTLDEKMQVQDLQSTAQMLEVPDSNQLTFDLAQIKQLTELGQVLTAETRLQPGTKVRITSGPFQNFEGEVVKHRSGDRFLVAVNYLSQGVSVELGDCGIEMI